jgi:hypothetical protein
VHPDLGDVAADAASLGRALIDRHDEHAGFRATLLWRLPITNEPAAIA